MHPGENPCPHWSQLLQRARMPGSLRPGDQTGNLKGRLGYEVQLAPHIVIMDQMLSLK